MATIKTSFCYEGDGGITAEGTVSAYATEFHDCGSYWDPPCHEIDEIDVQSASVECTVSRNGEELDDIPKDLEDEIERYALDCLYDADGDDITWDEW